MRTIIIVLLILVWFTSAREQLWIVLAAPLFMAHSARPRQALREQKGARMLRSQLSSVARAALMTALAALAGCVVYQEPHPVYQQQPVHIPPGHLPPPGQCRVWYPDRPPGHQPPPGPCEVLQYQVPPGAVLVRG
jgi:hypothetical protein